MNTQTKVEIPAGYRQLDAGDTIQSGDLYFYSGLWVRVNPTVHQGVKRLLGFEYIRKIDQTKPKASAIAAHTPGPWTYNDDGQIQCRDINTYGNFIVAGMGRELTPEDHANARLIAAAPTMLETLRTARDSNRVTWEYFDELNHKSPRIELQGTLDLLDRECDQYNAAIKAATGGDA